MKNEQQVLKGKIKLGKEQTEFEFLDWTDEQVSRFWDYESLFPENYFAFQVGKYVVEKALTYSKDRKVSILDYGAGPGFIIPYLLESGNTVTAGEFSTESIKKINSKFGGKSGFEGAFTIDQLMEQNKTFDLIILLEVIEHLDDHYLDLTINNVKKLLATDGKLFITTPNNEDLTKSLLISPESGKVYHRWQHIRNWSKETMESFLKSHGFNIIDMLETDFSLNKHIDEIINQPLPSISPLKRKFYQLFSPSKLVKYERPDRSEYLNNLPKYFETNLQNLVCVAGKISTYEA